VKPRIVIGTCFAVAVLISPAAAGAATKSVYMGPPPSAQSKLGPSNADVNDFFPHGVTIHVGDSVSFIPVGFHTTDIPPKGAGPAPAVAPSGTTIAGLNDAAGSPFWFNGQPDLQFTPAMVNPQFGKSVKYRGTKRVESGLPLAAKPKPLKVTFAKKGSFTYFCDVHPGMTGKVRVLAKTSRVPSKAADAKALKAQISRDVKAAAAAASATAPPNTVLVGSAGSNGVESYVFLPAKLTVPVGTTVTFSMAPKSYETHTATTGPGDPSNPSDTTSYLSTITSTLQNPPFDQRALYPSDPPPGGPAKLTPTLHGNGFWNTGFMDTASASPPPNAVPVTFAAAGTYEFYCLVHAFMHGTVVAQ